MFVKTNPNQLWLFVIVLFVAPASDAFTADVEFDFDGRTVASTARRIATCDLDNDGHLDVVVAGTVSGEISTFLGDGAGNLALRATYDVQAPFSLATGDLDNDGDIDVLTTNVLGGGVTVLLGDGTGALSVEQELSTGSSPFTVVIEDFNEDGNADFVVTNTGSGTVAVYVGDGTGTFSFLASYPNVPQPAQVTTADFDGDGNLDLAVATSQGSIITFMYGNGNGTFPVIINVYMGVDDSLWDLVATDVDDDGFMDLVAPCPSFDVIAVFYGVSFGGILPPVTYPAGDEPRDLSVLDVNGDGFKDIVALNVQGAEVSINLGTQSGVLTDPVFVPVAAGDDAIELVDLNEDGWPDFLTANPVGGFLSTYYNSGKVEEPLFHRGDASGNGYVTLEDAIVLLDHLFFGGEVECLDAADSDDDGQLGISDAARVLDYLYTVDAPPIPDPGPAECGVDPTTDGLGCPSDPHMCP